MTMAELSEEEDMRDSNYRKRETGSKWLLVY